MPTKSGFHVGKKTGNVFIESNHQANTEGVAGVQYIPFEDGDEWSSDIGQQAQAHMSLGERVAADESPAV